MAQKGVAETNFIEDIESSIDDKDHERSSERKPIVHIKSISSIKGANGNSDSNIKSMKNTDGVIINALKPILWILKIFGFYYEPSSRNSRVDINHPDDCETSILTNCQSHSKKGIKSIKGNIINNPLRVYALAVCILLWFNAGRFIANLITYSNTPWMPFVILYALWVYQVAGSATLLFYMCQRKLPAFFNYVNTVHDNESADCLACIGRYTRRCTLIYLSATLIFAILNWCFPIFFQFGPFPELKATMSVVHSPFQNTTVFPYIYIFAIHFYSTAVWIYPVIFFCLCCLVVAKKFRILCKRFRKAVNASNTNAAQTIMIYRKQHETYCITTELLSDAFSLYLAHIYATNIGIACFNLYRLLFNFTANGFLMNITLMMWLISTTAFTILISWVASILNKEVRNVSNGY